MLLRDSVRWTLRALWIQKIRSLLTVVGFSIGIAAMVLLSALGEGLRFYVMSEFTQFGSHIIAITPGKTETFGMSGILNTTRPLSLEDAEALSRLQHIEEVVPVVIGTAQVKQGTRSRYTDVAGVGPLAHRAWQLELALGSFLPQEDFRAARPLAVLGSTVRTELFGSRNPLGEFIRIGGQRFRVVGVNAPKGEFLGTDLDDMVFIPAGKGLQLFNRESLMEIDVFYSPRATAAQMSTSIRELLIKHHGYEDFTIVTQDQVLETMDDILNILKYAAAGLGAISLLVGGVGIATILMITVNERIAEVGLLRALGGTSRQVRRLFLGEALMLGLLGGLIGIGVVALAVLLATQIAPTLPIALSPQIIFAALTVSLLIGLVAGVQPAASAARLTPIDALRAE